MLHHVTFWAILGGVIMLLFLFFIWARRRALPEQRMEKRMSRDDLKYNETRRIIITPYNHDDVVRDVNQNLGNSTELSSNDKNKPDKSPPTGDESAPASEPEPERSYPRSRPPTEDNACPPPPPPSSRPPLSWRNRWGKAGMSYDQRMKLHKRYPVIAEIAAPGVSLKVTFGKEVEDIPISDLMTCNLQGEHFDIVALHHDEQVILNDRPTIWKWNVIPQKTGVRKLTLVVSRKIKIGDDTGYHDQPVLERYASINVDPIHETGRFMVKNWQWIAGTIAGSGVLWHFLSKGK